MWGDWENPYLTLSPDYEAAQVSIVTLCLSLERFVGCASGMLDENSCIVITVASIESGLKMLFEVRYI